MTLEICTPNMKQERFHVFKRVNGKYQYAIKFLKGTTSVLIMAMNYGFGLTFPLCFPSRQKAPQQNIQS